MSYESYNLEVISQHPEFKGKKLKKYAVDGLNTVGVWGNEPFEVLFTNNTWGRVQVKLSIDGTDILSGKPATTDSTGDMWIVEPYKTLTLKAWPETNKHGAQFIFTSAEKSVAVNTHGDLSSRSVIAAAVYVEGRSRYDRFDDYYKSSNIRRRVSFDPTFSPNSSGGWSGTLNANSTSKNSASNIDDSIGASASMDYMDVDYERQSDSRGESSQNLKSLAAVGAGQQVNQTIVNVAGLIKPQFSQVIRVRYQWWDELQDELKAKGISSVAGSGFPGDVEKNIMSIGSTPRIGEWKVSAFPVAPPVSQFTRF